MLLIGSCALEDNGLYVNRRIRDCDYICTIDEFRTWYKQHRRQVKHTTVMSEKKYVAFMNDSTINEFEIAWPGSAGMDLLEHFDAIGTLRVATPPTVLALKLSHRYLKDSPHFIKTMNDILFLRDKGVQLNSWLACWLEKRERETYTYKHPNLKQSKQNFFTDNVKYVFDHDSIHRAVATYDKPAYMYFKAPGEDVMCSKHLFFELPEHIRLAAVMEEAYVLAIERSIVPHPGALTPDEAFEKALMKICTSITSGWFREYAWEHYYEAIQQYDRNYVRRFHKGLDNGIVTLHQR